MRYTIGSRLQVQVSRVDLDGRKIDFRIVQDEAMAAASARSGGGRQRAARHERREAQEAVPAYAEPAPRARPQAGKKRGAAASPKSGGSAWVDPVAAAGFGVVRGQKGNPAKASVKPQGKPVAKSGKKRR